MGYLLTWTNMKYIFYLVGKSLQNIMYNSGVMLAELSLLYDLGICL